MNFVSERVSGFEQSEIRRMTRECVRVGGINLGQGICDMPTPPLVRDGAIAAIRAQKSTYSYLEGTDELRAVIAEKVARDNGIDADPQRNIIVTVGATGAFTTAMIGLLNPGDGILLFEPYYGYHRASAMLAGLTVQFASPTAPEFSVTEDIIVRALTPKTRAIVVCTPANPSGKMWSREELDVVAKVAHERNLLVITDEIYEYIRYDNRPHISPASLPKLRDRTVTIMGLSKTFSITGWRLGYAVAPEPMAKAMGFVNDTFYVCAPTPLQLGAAAGFAAPKTFFDDLATGYQKKRDRFCAALERAGMKPIVPQGAYYVMADISAWRCATARDAAMQLLERTGVAAVAGSAFYQGNGGESLLRFCFAKEDSELDEAISRLS